MKSFRNILWFSLAVNIAIVLADLCAAPLHATGRGQGGLGYFVGAAHLLNMPGFTAAEWTGLRPHHNWSWAGFWVGLAANLVVWAVIGIVGVRLKRRIDALTPPPADLYEAGLPVDKGISRRRLLLGGGRAVAGVGMGVGSWSFFGEARWFEVTRQQIGIRGLSPGLNGLRIVQLSDIHHGSWMSLAWVRQIIDVTNALAPDVVCLTGDYVYRGLEYVRPVAKELARLRPRVGVVGVMGNHDWWENGTFTRTVFGEEGVPLIDNDRIFVTPGRRMVKQAGEGLCFAGVGDLWEDKCLYGPALGGVPGGMPRILLSHNPDVAEQAEFLQSGYRVDLMLSGHTHGGQISLPVVGAPVTNSAFGQKYAKGLVQGPVCPVYVSRGLGMTVMPVRLGVRPEVAVIELRGV